MPYTLYWSSGAKPAIIINYEQIDTTSTSLTLFGKGFENYGQNLQTDLIRMLESWCATTPPPNPTTGQLWYDAGTHALKVFNGNVFVNTAVNTASVEPINPVVGELWFNSSNSVLSLFNGTLFVPVFTGNTVGVVNDAAVTHYITQQEGGAYIRMTSGLSNAVVVQDNVTVPFAIGTTVKIRQAGTGLTTISPATGVTLLSPGPATLAGQGHTATIVKVDIDTWDVSL